MRGGKRPGEDEDSAASERLGARRAGRLRFASILTAVASALWIAQSFVLAQAVGVLLGADAETAGLAPAAIAFALLAVSRIALDALAGHLAAQAAERVQLRARSRLLDAAARSSPFDARRPHSGEIAAVLTHHVEALAPYLRRKDRGDLAGMRPSRVKRRGARGGVERARPRTQLHPLACAAGWPASASSAILRDG